MAGMMDRRSFLKVTGTTTAGLAGILFAACGRFVNPDRFGLGFASSTVVYVLLGGRTSRVGHCEGSRSIL